jgi:hypothetical protein
LGTSNHCQYIFPALALPRKTDFPVETRTESSNLLAVLDQLDTNTLSDGGVGLLGLDTDLLKDDTLGVGGATEGRGLVGSAQSTALPVKISPLLILAVCSQLPRRVETTGFASSHDCFVGLAIGKMMQRLAREMRLSRDGRFETHRFSRVIAAMVGKKSVRGVLRKDGLSLRNFL